MFTIPDNTSLYGSVDGYQKVLAHYDKAIDSMGIPYEDRFLETSFGLTHVIVCGNDKGKPIVLWHGQNANATTYIRWIPALAQAYCLYAVDTIGGMGKSAATRPSRKGTAYGEWAAEVVKALDLQQANMIGISNGGWLILKLGGVAAELIASAILLSSAGLMPVSMKLVWQIVTRSVNKDPRVIAERLVELLSPPDLPADPFYIDFFELILTSKFRGEQIAPRITDEELQTLNAPVYILMGQYERSFDAYKALERGVNLLPNVTRAELVPGVGHSMEHREPEWVINRISDYLEKHAI
jgi:pimeloyl-ACP methyl ester carboxylesterase